jgi:branched-chain amino acid transport system ATP-binding protein
VGDVGESHELVRAGAGGMLLEVHELVAGYGPVRALDGVSLEVGEREAVAIIGANGAGKTTLLMAISGLVAARTGTVRFRDRPLGGVPPHAIVRAGIGHVPEGRRIFPRLTVRENLELGAVARRERTGVAADIATVCELFPVLAARMRQPGGTLSGGEQQMLAIGRALVGRPRLLLLDEPSLGLAPLVVEAVFGAIAALVARGLAVVLVEQNAGAALRLAARGYVLENGRIVLAGPAAALAVDPRVRAAYLGGA